MLQLSEYDASHIEIIIILERELFEIERLSIIEPHGPLSNLAAKAAIYSAMVARGEVKN